MEDLSGKQLGQYRLVAPLGEGGMAFVYKAYHPSMERYVAIKILPRHYAAEPDFIHRFKQEARIIANLEHPNILPVYDYGEADGYTYIVMRYIEGGKTLTNLMQGQPLPLAQMLNLLSKIAAALDYAHSRGVVHRDVKPSNVLIDQQGNILLSDFGLAKVFASSSRFTVSGAFLGTPAYASPEQCLGRSDLDGRSDVYSLGVILYEMATGRPPFDAETPMAVAVKHINDPLPLPRKLNPALPESLERVILKALAKQPGDRYQTAGEMARALTEIIAESGQESTLDIPAWPKPPAAPTTKKRPIPVWGWALGCLGILAIGAILVGLGLGIVLVWRGPASLPTSPAMIGPAEISPTPPRAPMLIPSASPTFLAQTPSLTATETTASATLPAPTSAPTTALPAGSPEPIQEYGMPLAGGKYLVFDTAMRVVSGGQLVKLDLIVEEGRFKAAESIPFAGRAIAWNAERGQYWSVRDVAGSCGLDLIDPSGNVTASYSLPEDIECLDWIAWDGVYLFGATGQMIYKLQPPETAGRLQLVDSYAPAIHNFPNQAVSGLTWDGESLWALAKDALARLDKGGRPVCSIWMYGGPNWWGYEGLVWDGRWLWVAYPDANTLYRVDPASCR